MGRRNYLVEGLSGTGKTSVADELQRRGYHAVHGDRELAYRGDPDTGEPTRTGGHEHHVWDVAQVRALVADHSEAVTFFCGGSRNFSTFIDLFDAVFVLDVDLATLNHRLDRRPDDEWGGGVPMARERIEHWHATGDGVPDGVRIDATRPLRVVVDDIERRCRLSEHLPRVLDAAAAADHADAVALVWREAFGPIADISTWRETIFDRHRSRAAYRLALAFDDDGPTGFAWGYVGQRGQFWPDRVLDRLGPVAEPWVGGHVEFVELAVADRARGHGVGGRLHDALLAALPQRHALLGTSADPGDPAVRLYRSRGWTHLGLLAPDTQVMMRPAPSGRT
jgi:ribosomal protein S18 acetylase RimI-like enzyme